MARVNYYNKLNKQFEKSANIRRFSEISSKSQSAYYYDLREVVRYFPDFSFDTEFGDITKIPDFPTLVKSRPIAGDNKNSILLKFNKIRHFNFCNDKIPFVNKSNSAIWRGKAKVNHPRWTLVNDWYRHSKCDVGQSNSVASDDDPGKQKRILTIAEQLQHKFVISVEGNDVATNLKWIMSSNSLCFTPKPKFETWFMEGQLIADYHYVLLKDDCSDLEEKIDYYSENTEAAVAIIRNANDFTTQFRNLQREHLISLLTIKKYFDLGGDSQLSHFTTAELANT